MNESVFRTEIRNSVSPGSIALTWPNFPRFYGQRYEFLPKQWWDLMITYKRTDWPWPKVFFLELKQIKGQKSFSFSDVRNEIELTKLMVAGNQVYILFNYRYVDKDSGRVNRAFAFEFSKYLELRDRTLKSGHKSVPFEVMNLWNNLYEIKWLGNGKWELPFLDK